MLKVVPRDIPGELMERRQEEELQPCVFERDMLYNPNYSGYRESNATSSGRVPKKSFFAKRSPYPESSTSTLDRRFRESNNVVDRKSRESNNAVDRRSRELTAALDRKSREQIAIPDMRPRESAILPDMRPRESAILPDMRPRESAILPDMRPRESAILPDMRPRESAILLDKRTREPITTLDRRPREPTSIKPEDIPLVGDKEDLRSLRLEYKGSEVIKAKLYVPYTAALISRT